MDSSAVEGRRPRFLTKMVEAAQSKAIGPGGGSWRSETFRPGPRRQGTNRKLEGDGTKLQVSDQKRAVSDPNFKVSDSKLEGAVPQPVSLAGVLWVFFLWSGRPRGHGTAFQKADRKNEPQKNDRIAVRCPVFRPAAFWNDLVPTLRHIRDVLGLGRSGVSKVCRFRWCFLFAVCFVGFSKWGGEISGSLAAKS